MNSMKQIGKKQLHVGWERAYFPRIWVVAPIHVLQYYDDVGGPTVCIVGPGGGGSRFNSL